MPTDDTEILVIGAGLMGSAAARSLAERGHEVTVVERDVPAGALGSSHGSARIVRLGYPDPLYTRLAARSRTLFDELERRSGRSLISPTGSLDVGTVRDPARLAGILRAEGLHGELLSAEEARERWPGIAPDTEVLWSRDAGVLDAETTVHTQLDLARAAGARLLSGWEAGAVRRGAGGWSVTATDGARIRARQVVLAVGGWFAPLTAATELPPRFAGRLPAALVTQENAFHFPYRQPVVAPGGDAAWPTTIHESRDLVVYSLAGGRDAGHRGQKVAEFLGGTPLIDARARTGRVDPANRERIIEYVARHLPGLVPEPYAETTCLFTMLPREDFLIDAADGLVLASPCSGHGAKFAPLVGELVADLAEGREGIERFRAASFARG